MNESIQDEIQSISLVDQQPLHVAVGKPVNPLTTVKSTVTVLENLRPKLKLVNSSFQVDIPEASGAKYDLTAVPIWTVYIFPLRQDSTRSVP